MQKKEMNSNKVDYTGKIPPCGIYCGTCPVYVRNQNKCKGMHDGCLRRKCKGIFQCAEKRGITHCGYCSIYPCFRFNNFARRWLKHGQNLLNNQHILVQSGEKGLRSYYEDKKSKIKVYKNLIFFYSYYSFHLSPLVAK